MLNDHYIINKEKNVLNHINTLLSYAVNHDIPDYIKQTYLKIYPGIIDLIKTNTSRPETVIDDIELIDYKTYSDKEAAKVGVKNCLYIKLKYRGVKDNKKLIYFIQNSNANYMVEAFNRMPVKVPHGYGVILYTEYLGPAQKVYEKVEREDDLKKIFVEFKKSGILKSYSIMLKFFADIFNSSEEYPFLHGGRHTAGILNIKYPIANRLSTSAQFNNYISIIVDNSEKWKKYPKRTGAIMFSDSLMGANIYGDTLYYILPRNDANIGICPRSDFWNAFVFKKSDIYSNITVHSINRFLQYFSSLIFKRNIDKSSYSKFKDDIDEIEMVLKNIDLEDSSNMAVGLYSTSMIIRDTIESRDCSLIEFLEDFISPDSEHIVNDKPFISTNTKNLINTYNEKLDGIRYYTSDVVSNDECHELWTDTPCLILAKHAALEFLEYMKLFNID